MGGDSKKKKPATSLPLPAPTESESIITAPTDAATDVSRPGDEKSSYSLPEDGTPVTIKTRGHSANRSQTSLLIEYFEGGKSTGSESPGSRKPSVRVRLKPSGSRKDDHIMISKPKSSSSHGRKASLARRSSTPQKGSSSAARDVEAGGSGISGSGDGEDNRSVNSYASATEESNVSRNPIVVEIDRSGGGGGVSSSHQRQRPRRPTSPLIPTAASSRASASYLHGTQSELSAIPADSFLDGSKSPRSSSPVRDLAAAAAATAAAAAGAAALERHRVTSRSRGDDQDRIVVSKSSSSRDRDKERDREKSERKHRPSRSRTSSLNVTERDDATSPSHRRSSRHRHHNESAVSGPESSIMSSALSPSHRSYDQYSIRSGASKTSSINNPKLLETVEDAIRRLILPELNALRREHSQRDRRSSTTSTGTNASRDEYAATDRRRSGASDRIGSASHTPRDKESGGRREIRDREGRHALEGSPSPAVDYASDSGNEAGPATHTVDDTPKRSTDKLKTAAIAGAAGAALGGLAAAAMADHDGSPSTARDQRRRRRAEARNKDFGEVHPTSAQQHQRPPDVYLTGAHSAASRSFEDDSAQRGLEDTPGSDVGLGPGRIKHLEPDASYLQPPMPLMSEINSDVTRTSILSAETDRPRSASEELQATGSLSVGSGGTPTPNTTAPSTTLQGLGTQHANISHGDLKALPRRAVAGASYPPVGEEGFDDNEDEHESMLDHQQQQHEYSEQYLHEGEDEEYVEEYDGMPEYGSQTYDAYGHQIVPAPLKYVPYQPEHRGLSPIPSVSGYTEGGASEVQGYRDSGLTATSHSSPGKSPRPDRKEVASPSSIPSNILSREFDPDGLSVRSSDIDYRPAPTQMTDVTDDGDDNNFRAVEGIAANPDIVHTPVAIESAVASLVDGSVADGSALTGDSSVNGGYVQVQGARGSMDTLEEEQSHGQTTPKNQSVESHQHTLHEGDDFHEHEMLREISASSPTTTRTNPSEFSGEYEIDQYGRKVRRPSPTASEAAAITAGAVGLAIQAARDRNQHPYQAHEVHDPGASHSADEWVPAGVQRNKSFKERTMDGRRPANTPTHSTDRLDEYDQPHLGASGLPDLNNPIPAIGYGYAEDDLETNPSVVHGHVSDHEDDEWRTGDRTPTQEHHEQASHALGLVGAAAAAMAGTAAAEAALGASQHSRQTSQERDEEWQRSSDERKRDTLITNPYEGTSPIMNESLIKKSLPNAANSAAAAAASAAAAAAYGTAGPDYTSRSPLGGRYDEGYISQGPGKSPDLPSAAKGKGIDYQDVAPAGFGGGQEDPFYTTNQTRHFSGLSHGMATPLYDAATGSGIDRIENKDIVALMQHLMVRDAQRSARDTEILVTLVRAAAEMRTSFENVRTMLAMHEKGINNEFSKKLADSEDAIITEILDGTEKTVRTHLGGPRPFPGSGARSLHASVSQGDMDDLPAKRQNIFRRALKSLNAKGNNDLTRIEDMLNQLLMQVDVLKAQSAGGAGPGGISASGSASGHGPSPYDGMIDAQMAYEQDRGYEPEGHAGTSTTSHASQSGLLSVTSRGGPPQSSKLGGYERKFSDNRISTVMEGNEDELEYSHGQGGADDENDDVGPRGASGNVHFGSTTSMPQMSSALLATPTERQPQVDHQYQPEQSQPQLQLQNQQGQQTLLSNDNTPRTEKAKKHKSSSSSSWFPKISRWSETTTSSVGRVFRSSRDSKKDHDDLGFHSGPSRSGSDLAGYDAYNPSAGDKLHSGFSEADLHGGDYLDAPIHQQQQLQQRHQDQEQYQDDIHGYHLPPDSTEILPPNPKTYMTPEDPKYRAHRDSLNLQHPQPRSGQPFKAALESRAEDFDSPMSPRSAEWAGSATSLHRFPGQNTNRYSDNSATNAAAGNAASQGSQHQYWDSEAAPSAQLQAGPPRPPKEPLDSQHQQQLRQQQTPPRPARLMKAPKTSPLPYHSVESGYGTATHVPTSYTGSPRFENRNLSGALTVPTRRPSGPRAMTPKSERSARSYNDDEPGSDSRRRKRDTFGTIASQDTETF